jgi:ABC-type antimicrobial peptide transport system permease subunit
MLAFNVSRRRREIGIRMALGADTLRIVTQVLRQGFAQVVLGLVVGTGLAFLIGMMARDLLLGTNPADPSVYAGVLLTLVGVATLAFFIPARRAARLSPLEALRYE